MPTAVDKITLKANAKVNLTLDIQGRRSDGYHLLSSVMQSISLSDTITLTKRPRGHGISLTCHHPRVPQDSTNICWRAAAAFQRQVGMGDLSVDIALVKEIPVGAGLGGGSTDAAAVLLGLNALYQKKIKLDELQRIGATIGADVPFCLQGGTCLVRGIGEQVTPLRAFPAMTMVLVKPEASISTAEVYGKLDPKAYGGTSTSRLLELLEGTSDAGLDQILVNALESVTMSLVPEVRIWKERLIHYGASVSRMSGSGPTVYGLFAENREAGEFKARFQEEAQVFVVTLMDTGVFVPETNGGDQL
jgi:4-diphosphocytidyl-2-C-methyl-D-erythritol kinase